MTPAEALHHAAGHARFFASQWHLKGLPGEGYLALPDDLKGPLRSLRAGQSVRLDLVRDLALWCEGERRERRARKAHQEAQARRANR